MTTRCVIEGCSRYIDLMAIILIMHNSGLLAAKLQVTVLGSVLDDSFILDSFKRQLNNVDADRVDDGCSPQPHRRRDQELRPVSLEQLLHSRDETHGLFPSVRGRR